MLKMYINANFINENLKFMDLWLNWIETFISIDVILWFYVFFWGQNQVIG